MFLRERNLNITTGIFRDLEDDSNSFYLKGSEVKIWTTFSNKDYDNDDNPYAKIVLEYKTRLEIGEGGPKGTIDLVPCKAEFDEFMTEDMMEFVRGEIYCPKFEENHSRTEEQHALGTALHGARQWQWCRYLRQIAFHR